MAKEIVLHEQGGRLHIRKLRRVNESQLEDRKGGRLLTHKARKYQIRRWGRWVPIYIGSSATGTAIELPSEPNSTKVNGKDYVVDEAFLGSQLSSEDVKEFSSSFRKRDVLMIVMTLGAGLALGMVVSQVLPRLGG